jgi:putative inorganic carbon (HCO3(-)) transporter
LSTTAIVWLLLFLGLSFKALSRPAFGISVYLMTVFALPPAWWWGKDFLSSLTQRWGLVASLILLVAVLIRSTRRPLSALEKTGAWVVAFYVLNALVVHFGFAANPPLSWENFILLAKQGLLLLLILLAIQSRKDFGIVLKTIFICSAYIGYEVVINDAGKMIKGRLELPVVPDANDSNLLSALLLLCFPIAGYFLLATRSRMDKVVAILGTPFILDTVLLCNSRGAFLALIAMGLWILVFSPGKIRKQSLLLLSLGLMAVLYLAKDEKIWIRFFTTFDDESTRDQSAASRLDFWKQALAMLSEHPLGAGGEAAFKSDLGFSYLQGLNQPGYRAVHNGYLDIACGWGVQGICLYAGVALCSWLQVARLRRWAKGQEDTESLMMAVSLQAMFVGQLVASMFISSLDNEWMTWLFALCLACEVFLRMELQDAEEESTEEFEEEEDYIDQEMGEPLATR